MTPERCEVRLVGRTLYAGSPLDCAKMLYAGWMRGSPVYPHKLHQLDVLGYGGGQTLHWRGHSFTSWAEVTFEDLQGDDAGNPTQYRMYKAFLPQLLSPPQQLALL